MEIIQLSSFDASEELLQVTPFAVQKILEARASDSEFTEKFAIRIAVKGGGCAGYQHDLNFDDEIDLEDDTVQKLSSEDSRIDLVVDSFSALYLKGVTLDYVAEGFSEGFKFTGGSVKKTCGCGSSVSY